MNEAVKKRKGFAYALAVCVIAGMLCGCADNFKSSAAPDPVAASVFISQPSPSPVHAPPAANTPEPSLFASPADLAVCIQKANVYSEKSAESEKAGTLADGDTAHVVSYGEEWVHISHAGIGGYVKRANLIRVAYPDVPVPEGDWSGTLVNQTHLLPRDFDVSVTGFEDGQVDARIAEICRSMFDDAKADGAVLALVDAYRSRERQSELFEAKVDAYLAKGYSRADAEKTAATITARPDTSEHQTGLALDIVTPSHTARDKGFAQTRAFAWLTVNAHNYGFILRYGQGKEDLTGVIWEPWHWRFVGRQAAKAMKQTGQSLEEYLGDSG